MGAGPIRPKALLFDLLTALIDSWSLWDAVAAMPPADEAGAPLT